MQNKLFKKKNSEAEVKAEQTAAAEKTDNKGKKAGYNKYYENKNVVDSGSAGKVPFAVVEAYKNIRIHVISILNEINGKILTITSPSASEGKSTTSVNVAITLSQLNKKVVLIDSDIRRATVNKKLQIPNNVGCSDFLNGSATLDDVIVNYNSYMDVITSGTVSENLSELFASVTFERMLSDLREKYDYIIIDTPPVNLVSDTLTIAQKSDGVAIVVRSAVTTYPEFTKALSTLEMLNVNVIGAIINGDGASKKKYSKYGQYGKYQYYKYKY